jgi:iron complex outermembrane receptor protein
VTPRLGVNYNFTPEINIFANFSQAKQEPAQGAIYNAGLIRTDLKPEFLRADVELGAGYVSKKVNAKLNYFYMDFTNELVNVYDPTNPSADSRGNTLKSAGRTLHSGVEFDATASPVSNLQINANLTVSNNKFIDWKDVSKQPNRDIVTFDYSNKKLPYFPTYMANLGATYTYEGAYINLAVSRIGPQYMDNLNLAAKVSAYTVVNAILGYSFHDILGAKSIDLTLNLNNITNSKYFVFGRASDTYNTSTKEIISSTPVYLPGPPANYFATIQFNW